MYKMNVKKLANFFKLQPFPSQPSADKDDDASFYALVGLLLTILNQYFNVSIDTNIFLATQRNTIKVGDTGPFSLVVQET